MRTRDVVTMVALGGALAACGPSTPAAQGGGPGAAGTEDLDCQGAHVSETVLDSAPFASTLPASAQRAFPALTGVKDVGSYRVLADRDGHLTIGRSLSEQDHACWRGSSR